MTISDYMQRAVALESNDWDAIRERITYLPTIRKIHAMVGICTECGELQDQVKKFLFYGKPLDNVNLVEELGDLVWYINLLLNDLGVSWDNVMEKNINKLELRYKDKKFKETQALNRDLGKEREILEK